jgi:hypothetical protein
MPGRSVDEIADFRQATAHSKRHSFGYPDRSHKANSYGTTRTALDVRFFDE